MTATVCAWNIKAMPNPIPSERALRIADGISLLDPEIIVLTEVREDPILNEIVARLESYGSDYEHVLLDQTADLNIGVLFKNGVTVTNARLIEGSNIGEEKYRKALAVDVSVGTFDFILVGVHLKSGRDNAERADRTKQAKVIANFMTNATQGSEKDVLVLGDYNMIPDDDQENFDALSAGGFLRFISSQDLEGQGSHISADGSIGNLLDGYAVSQQHTTEYIDGTLQIFPLHRAMGVTLGAFSSQVSDHLPLTGRFDIAVEDDD